MAFKTGLRSIACLAGVLGFVATGQAWSANPEPGVATGTNLQTSQTPTPQLDKADPTVDIQLAAAHGGMKGKAEAPGVSAMRDRRRQLLEMLGAERVRHGKMPAAMRAEIQEHIDWLEGRVNNVTAQLRQQGVSDDMLAMDETMAMKAVGAEAVTVTVKGYTFEGNASIASEALDGLVSDTVGRTLTFSQLNEVVGRVTKHYRDNGFVVARAYLPAQEIANGSIKVGVLEGKPGFVAANTSESRLDVVFANKYLEPLRSAGSLKQAELERSLLLLNDLAGVEVSSTLKPGQKVGETDIDVAVSDTEHFTGSVDFNNFGGDNNGEYRLGGTFNINNLTGRGDQVQFRGFSSTEGDTWLASVGYVTPIGSKGTKLGARYAYMRGDVGEEFASLGIESEAETFSLYGVHPIVRSRAYNVYGQVGYDYKDIREEWDPAFAVKIKDRLDIASIAFTGDLRDNFMGGGITTFHAGLFLGMKELDQTASDMDAEGQFTKLNYEIARLQRVTRLSNIYARLAGQFSNNRMVSSEQFSLGGPTGVRGYPGGDGLGDYGWILTAEWQQNLPLQPYQSYFDVTQLYTFVDMGQAKLNHKKSDQDDYDRSGAGLGIKLGKSRDFMVDLSYAWAIDNDGGSTVDDDGQFWMQAVKWFE